MNILHVAALLILLIVVLGIGGIVTEKKINDKMFNELYKIITQF